MKKKNRHFPRGLRDTPLCGVVGLNGGCFFAIIRPSFRKPGYGA
ncbi:hypothetical protein [Salmonella enterica]|nr:hypothetical protein [Salmonella enterica]